jgi:iron complex outermembrane receptor protein
VPTFTERYYSDPANLARPDVGPERAWAGEAGADLFLRDGWIAQATVFARADRDVIDWLRPSAAERWRTFNIRNVDIRGLEVGVRKAFGGAGFLQANYTALDLDAAAVDQLSKYVLDYAPHSIAASGMLRMRGRFTVAPRLEYRRRKRSSGDSEYVLLDARLARRVSRLYEISVDGTNLLGENYEEVAGVAMPGRAATVSFAIGVR